MCDIGSVGGIVKFNPVQKVGKRVVNGKDVYYVRNVKTNEITVDNLRSYDEACEMLAPSIHLEVGRFLKNHTDYPEKLKAAEDKMKGDNDE